MASKATVSCVTDMLTDFGGKVGQEQTDLEQEETVVYTVCLSAFISWQRLPADPHTTAVLIAQDNWFLHPLRGDALPLTHTIQLTAVHPGHRPKNRSSSPLLFHIVICHP